MVTTESSRTRERDRDFDPSRLATAALIGIAVYVVIDIVLAFLRPDYSLISNAESDYGRGPFSWLMDVNFVIRGLFSAFAAVAMIRAGVARRWMAVLVWVWAVASALLAAFADNPAGYPYRRTGPVHDLLGLIAFVAIVIGTIAISFARSSVNGTVATTQRILSIAGAVVFVALAHPLGAFGLVERIFLAVELAWMIVTLVEIRRQRPAA